MNLKKALKLIKEFKETEDYTKLCILMPIKVDTKLAEKLEIKIKENSK